MLRTNSKAAKRNAINYIREATAAGLENYENPKNYDTASDVELTAYIWDIFQSEKYYTLETIKRRNILIYKVFEASIFKLYIKVKSLVTLLSPWRILKVSPSSE